MLEGNEIIYLNLEIERLKELAVSQLKDGETVWFGSDCGKAADRENGIWDDRTFDIDTLFQINSEMSKGCNARYKRKCNEPCNGYSRSKFRRK